MLPASHVNNKKKKQYVKLMIHRQIVNLFYSIRRINNEWILKSSSCDNAETLKKKSFAEVVCREFGSFSIDKQKKPKNQMVRVFGLLMTSIVSLQYFSE